MPAKEPLFDKTNRRYGLERKLGGGGEGEVYLVEDYSDWVIKRYNFERQRLSQTEQEKQLDKLKQKLSYMLAHKPEDPPSPPNSPVHYYWTWPLELLYQQRNQFAGYLMNKAHGEQCVEFYQLDSGQNWQARFQAAKNLAVLVKHTHDAGYIIGDLNSRNIFFRPLRPPIKNIVLPTLIDVDSFQINDRVTGEVLFHCGVANAEYAAPELNAGNTGERQKEQDYFALSILIFQLLMLGAHPFSGISHDNTLHDHRTNIELGRSFLFTEGFYPIKETPKLEVLPPKLLTLFVQTFQQGQHDSAQRASAEAWATALNDALEQNLVLCPDDGNHFYSNHQSGCPWCEYKKLFSDPFKKPSFQENISVSSASVSTRQSEENASIITQKFEVTEEATVSKNEKRQNKVVWLYPLIALIAFASLAGLWFFIPLNPEKLSLQTKATNELTEGYQRFEITLCPGNSCQFWQRRLPRGMQLEIHTKNAAGNTVDTLNPTLNRRGRLLDSNNNTFIDLAEGKYSLQVTKNSIAVGDTYELEVPAIQGALNLEVLNAVIPVVPTDPEVTTSQNSETIEKEERELIEPAKANTAPQITTPSTQSTLLGTNVSYQIQAVDAENDSLRFQAQGLPQGLEINASTGLVYGRVTNEGIYQVNITVDDKKAATETTFVWEIRNSDNDPPPNIPPTPVPDTPPSIQAIADQSHVSSSAINIQVNASDTEGSLQYMAEGLPPGLQINPLTGLISGTLASVQQVTTYPVRILVTDSSGQVRSTDFILYVVPSQTPEPSPPTPPSTSQNTVQIIICKSLVNATTCDGGQLALISSSEVDLSVRNKRSGQEFEVVVNNSTQHKLELHYQLSGDLSDYLILVGIEDWTKCPLAGVTLRVPVTHQEVFVFCEE
jgi:serine/threonine protein kinase